MGNNLEKFDQAVLEGDATWWQMNLPSGSVSFGDAKANMLGYDEKDFKNYTDFTSLVHPDDYEIIMQAMRDHLDGKKELYETSYRIRTIDGSYVRFYDCGKIISKEDKNIVLMGFVWRVNNDLNIKKEMSDFRKMILSGKPSVVDLISKIRQ